MEDRQFGALSRAADSDCGSREHSGSAVNRHCLRGLGSDGSKRANCLPDRFAMLQSQRVHGSFLSWFPSSSLGTLRRGGTKYRADFPSPTGLLG